MAEEWTFLQEGGMGFDRIEQLSNSVEDDYKSLLVLRIECIP
jgi:hypothetical protein